MNATLIAALKAAGLDLQQAFEVQSYNAIVDAPLFLPDFGRAATYGLLLGNTRALWPIFLEALKADSRLLEHPDPLDTYVESAVQGALRSTEMRCEVRFAHVMSPPLAAQRLAHISGLAYLSPGQLSIHPKYGPWIGLRAALCFDAEAPVRTEVSEDPCGQCKSACEPALARALKASKTLDHQGVAERWRDWLAVRDACEVGRAHRYSDAQILYHYRKDPAQLRQLVS